MLLRLPLSTSVVPNFRDLMPNDLRWSWYNNNRNKVRNKCNVFESSWKHLPDPVHGKIVFQEIGPWCQKDWGPLPNIAAAIRARKKEGSMLGLCGGEGETSLSTKGQSKQFIYTFVVQSLSRVRLFVTPSTAALQASLYFTISWSLLKLMSIESVMPSNHLILCRFLIHLVFGNAKQHCAWFWFHWESKNKVASYRERFSD